MTISIKLENRHLFFLGAIIILAAAVQLSLGATGTTPVNPGHPLSQTWIDTDLNMSTRNVIVNGGVINVSYPGAGSIPLTINGISVAGGYPIGTNKWFLAQGDPTGGIDGGRVWVQYGAASAPVLVLEDYDDQPRIQFQQVGTGTEAAPQYSGWIGMAKENSNDLALMGGNVGIGTTNPGALVHIKGSSVADSLLIEGSTTPTAEDASVLLKPLNAGAHADIEFLDSAGTAQFEIHTHPNTATSGIQFSSVSRPMDFYVSGGSRIYITAGGNVGIGTTTPAAKLDVNGNVRIGSVAVQTNHELCWRADKTIGWCSGSTDGSGTNPDGSCICNAIT